MKKREFRENLFKLLYSLDNYNEEEYKEQIAYFLEEENVNEKDGAFITEKLGKIAEKIEDIDDIIQNKSIGWDISRIARTDLAALRIGIYEITMDDDVSVKVAINEAVNLAAAYGTDKSAGFVNGILAAVAKDDSIPKVEKNDRVKDADKEAESEA
ncbi:MAG: transcription antitermination factor NusB [Lachnospiraceae bacterium]|nr:transcription antitermination factor NusB [Lachnospiraceae bacterium]